MCFGGSSNSDTTMYCSGCNKETKHEWDDCWDPDVGDTRYQRADGCYERHNYYRCKKCGNKNSDYKVTWHPGL